MADSTSLAGQSPRAILTTGRRILRLPDVMHRTSLRKASIYRLIAAREFPAPVKLGSASGWFDDEIDRWMQRLDEARAR